MNLSFPARSLAIAVAAGASLALGGCGASGNDLSSGAAASAGGCATAASSGCALASAAPVTTVATGACTTTGSGRTDDFHQQVSLQPAAADGLQVGDIVAGSGPMPSAGQTLTVQYTGWLQDGTQFDSSRTAGRKPFQFLLGQGQVIKAWDESFATMHVGGVRRLVAPPALAYGAAGSPPVIPANATLTFDVELLCAG